MRHYIGRMPRMQIFSWRPGFRVTQACLGIFLVLLAACDGPNEAKGRAEDRAEAAAAGLNLATEGPQERLGEAQDRVERADARARRAGAEALERRGDQLRAEAAMEADRLDEQAKAMREEK
jgi:hypothetical protein